MNRLSLSTLLNIDKGLEELQRSTRPNYSVLPDLPTEKYPPRRFDGSLKIPPAGIYEYRGPSSALRDGNSEVRSQPSNSVLCVLPETQWTWTFLQRRRTSRTLRAFTRLCVVLRCIVHYHHILSPMHFNVRPCHNHGCDGVVSETYWSHMEKRCALGTYRHRFSVFQPNESLAELAVHASDTLGCCIPHGLMG